jgi:tagatose 6-phosphate kinase
MRALTVTLNAAIDTTYVIDRLVAGDINRVDRRISVPGGKGNNVARVLTALGHEVVATGFVAGRAGEFIESGLRNLGIETAFYRVPGESRTCLTVLEREGSAPTELLEPGISIERDDAAAFVGLLPQLAASADVVVFSGSLQQGLPDDYYAALLSAIRPVARSIALDTSGDALRLGLRGRPDLIKPNAAELRSLAGQQYGVEELIAFAQRQIIGSRVSDQSAVLLSEGAEGAALITGERVVRALPPRVPVRNTVGCGDALLAGYLSARSQCDAAEALRWGVATAAAAAQEDTAGRIDTGLVATLLSQIQIHVHAPLGSRE